LIATQKALRAHAAPAARVQCSDPRKTARASPLPPRVPEMMVDAVTLEIVEVREVVAHI
jgi:hypothetical protein